MDVATLRQHATEAEQRVIDQVAARILAQPAIIVTLQEGERTRRYVVALEDEQALRPWVGVGMGLRTTGLIFGGQWLRGMGRVDEMYRTLDGRDVLKVEQADRQQVWGRPA